MVRLQWDPWKNGSLSVCTKNSHCHRGRKQVQRGATCSHTRRFQRDTISENAFTKIDSDGTTSNGYEKRGLRDPRRHYSTKERTKRETLLSDRYRTTSSPTVQLLMNTRKEDRDKRRTILPKREQSVSNHDRTMSFPNVPTIQLTARPSNGRS
ncbi:hypothetical protein J6590_018363 [Homalodisca vitripennis]|nr:hypothetical protein J6590_018363 [Homalodisca vitripennis]